MMASEKNFDRITAPFSDDVIGSVLTRSGTSRCYVVEPNFNTSVRSSQQQQLQDMPLSTASLHPLTKFSSLPVSATSAAESIERFLQTKLQSDGSSMAPARYYAFHPSMHGSVNALYPQTFVPYASTDSLARTVSTAVATMSISCSDVSPTRQKKWWASMRLKACREQCRTNQARYRQKQREYVVKLESTVAQLREEIPTLEVQHRRLRYDPRQRVRDVVAEYFQLFHHGVGSDAFEQGSVHTSDVLRASKAQQQLMFLRSTMAPNVDFGNVCGVEMLMKHWRRMSEYHENLRFQLSHMEKVSDIIVIATAILSVTITKTTLKYVFPHLMMSDNVEDLSLAVKLLGHKLDYPCSVLFLWNEETSLVMRVETNIDITLPFLKLLGNLKDVSRVIEGAAMTPTSSL
ncbi:unnamed protein product [Peronospora belbahrii]|uniref:BZIP domain-containing protein n=1 Tax=Peronospora belbahrii TaxID=622444 RepID=A0AAU9L478_9STRA|nr:unnamed protein product [Peronospora belbahrii]